jgi:hypothetical protein
MTRSTQTPLAGVWQAALLLAGVAAACAEPPSAAASTTATATAPAAPPSSGPQSAAPTPACGGKELPDCPLQGWMKSTVQAYLNAGDKARLAKALDELGQHAPKGFANWAELSRAAAEAARAGDVAGVRTQCQSCHVQHRATYRAQMRTARLF